MKLSNYSKKGILNELQFIVEHDDKRIGDMIFRTDPEYLTFKTYQQHVISNAKKLAQELITLGYRVVAKGTDNHLMIIDLNFDIMGHHGTEGLMAWSWTAAKHHQRA